MPTVEISEEDKKVQQENQKNSEISSKEEPVKLIYTYKEGNIVYKNI